MSCQLELAGSIGGQVDCCNGLSMRPGQAQTYIIASAPSCSASNGRRHRRAPLFFARIRMADDHNAQIAQYLQFLRRKREAAISEVTAEFNEARRRLVSSMTIITWTMSSPSSTAC